MHISSEYVIPFHSNTATVEVKCAGALAKNHCAEDYRFDSNDPAYRKTQSGLLDGALDFRNQVRSLVNDAEPKISVTIPEVSVINPHVGKSFFHALLGSELLEDILGVGLLLM
ncbi:hypothetical protein CEXT_339861 [Caerostris extrusa]|uniref:Uncharacterized protein n=1 Tax=Caerostris extrusa TaxID=172846 RepID=A0AAV4Q228_CAEEX|nr:hypothetical protein CEXT_339861 [Caerostris extrusa]